MFVWLSWELIPGVELGTHPSARRTVPLARKTEQRIFFMIKYLLFF